MAIETRDPRELQSKDRASAGVNWEAVDQWIRDRDSGRGAARLLFVPGGDKRPINKPLLDVVTQLRSEGSGTHWRGHSWEQSGRGNKSTGLSGSVGLALERRRESSADRDRLNWAN